jgi:hypothetical protein
MDLVEDGEVLGSGQLDEGNPTDSPSSKHDSEDIAVSIAVLAIYRVLRASQFSHHVNPPENWIKLDYHNNRT